jgi:hypothetical protein
MARAQYYLLSTVFFFNDCVFTASRQMILSSSFCVFPDQPSWFSNEAIAFEMLSLLGLNCTDHGTTCDTHERNAIGICFEGWSMSIGSIERSKEQ